MAVGSRYPARTRSCRRPSKSRVPLCIRRLLAGACASTLRLAEVSPSYLLIAFNSCMVLSPTMTIALRILDATKVHALCGCAVWDQGYAYF